MPQRHAENFAPSAAKRWTLCPGSIKLLKGLPKQAESIHMKRGTTAHKVLELCLRRGNEPERYLGKTVEGITVDKGIVAGVDYALDVVRPILAKAEHWGTEAWVDIPETGEGGTVDLWAFVPDSGSAHDGTLYVWDYKNGVVGVDAAYNPQMMLYTLGVLAKLAAEGIRPSKAVLGILGPNFHGEQDNLTWSTTRAVLASWASTFVAPAVQAHKDGTARLVAGDHCQGCPVARCPARAEAAANQARVDFADFIAPPKGRKPVKPKQAPAAVSLLTKEQMLGVYQSARYLLSLVEACERDIMTALAKDPSAFKTMKLVEGRKNRIWRDPEAVAAALAKLGIRPSAYTKTSLAGLGQVEALLPPSRREAFLAKHTTKPQGSPTLADAADPRPALAHAKLDFADDFEEKA